ncbi:MAG: hypothetical protein K8S00_12195 [Bacteroidales bacterium]|nr:hypothetical protein [Bacteroidales bacterium]
MNTEKLKIEAKAALKEYGIDKIKDVADDLIELGEAIDKRLEDGEFTLLEKITLTPKVFALVGDFKDRKIIWLQFKDIDEQERQELINYVSEKLDLINDQAELIAEAIWGAIVSLGIIINLKKYIKTSGS